MIVLAAIDYKLKSTLMFLGGTLHNAIMHHPLLLLLFLQRECDMLFQQDNAISYHAYTFISIDFKIFDNFHAQYN